MAACEFDFRLSVTPDRLLPALRADFARFGGTISGDVGPGAGPGFGEFSLPTPLGEFAGIWEIAETGSGGCSIRIELDQKPMFVPCAAVEEHLARRLAKATATV